MPDITYARVVNGTVHGDPVTLPDDVKLGVDLFSPDEAALYHVCGSDVRDGWILDGKSFMAPPAPPAQVNVREVYGYAILGVLTDDERASSLSSAVKTWDRLMIQARPTPFPESNEKVGRFAKAIGTTPKSLFDRALGGGCVTAVFGPGADPCCAFGDPPLDGPVLAIFAGDAVSLPLTLWQTAPVYGPDSVTVVTPGVPVDMTGMAPGAEFLSYAQQPGTGVTLVVSNIVPTAGQFTVTAPGRGQAGDLTSDLPAPAPAKLFGPRIRVHYTDASGQHTFGTFYLAVR